MKSRRTLLFGVLALLGGLAVSVYGAKPPSMKGVMYVGTLDKKLLIINETNGDIVGEIPLGGIPRTTVLSADQMKLHVLTTQLQLETVDLVTRQVISSFPLSDGKSIPRMIRAGGRNFSRMMREIFTRLS